MTDKPTTPRPQLWGPDAVLLGYESDEWSVWISGMDEILPQPDLDTALRVAAELNATAHAVYDGHPYTPVTHALVLYRGRAWQRNMPLSAAPATEDGAR